MTDTTRYRSIAWQWLIPVLILMHTGFVSCTNAGMEKKKIVYVNSYHRGFPPSDQITGGVMDGLPADSFEVVAYFMDTKRNPSADFMKRRAAELIDSIREMKPDLLIASDDNAMKYLVVPYFQHDPLPIVFCGINWSAEQYDVSAINITGVLEILPVKEAIQTIRPYYPSIKKLLVLNENTTTSKKTRPILDTLLGNLGLEVTQALVDDFESWKSVFKEGNDAYDIIYLQTRGAIRGWDDEEAVKHVEEFIKVPLVTCEEFMMPYALLGVTQLSEEQGRVAAAMARSVLNGIRPGDIPVEKNRLTRVWINSRLAEKIGFQPEKTLKERAEYVE